ncbi:hypothetical protein LCGC14_0867170 [marine sediment metagenome]|uniref:Uncharacterized protein n=1 Tax=marine sediment metagenome TaxID=412755 RepID=A0A0F9PRD8_9ZZZZ
MNRKIKVYCYICGPKELTDEQYGTQLAQADIGWHCPDCPNSASWGGIELQCPNCNTWVTDEEAICLSCKVCMYCNNEGTPEQDNGQCPLCGSIGKGVFQPC